MAEALRRRARTRWRGRAGGQLYGPRGARDAAAARDGASRMPGRCSSRRSSPTGPLSVSSTTRVRQTGEAGHHEPHRRALPRGRGVARVPRGTVVEEVVAGIERSLEAPDELAAERRAVTATAVAPSTATAPTGWSRQSSAVVSTRGSGRCAGAAARVRMARRTLSSTTGTRTQWAMWSRRSGVARATTCAIPTLRGPGPQMLPPPVDLRCPWYHTRTPCRTRASATSKGARRPLFGTSPRGLGLRRASPDRARSPIDSGRQPAALPGRSTQDTFRPDRDERRRPAAAGKRAA